MNWLDTANPTPRKMYVITPLGVGAGCAIAAGCMAYLAALPVIHWAGLGFGAGMATGLLAAVNAIPQERRAWYELCKTREIPWTAPPEPKPAYPNLNNQPQGLFFAAARAVVPIANDTQGNDVSLIPVNELALTFAQKYEEREDKNLAERYWIGSVFTPKDYDRLMTFLEDHGMVARKSPVSTKPGRVMLAAGRAYVRWLAHSPTTAKGVKF